MNIQETILPSDHVTLNTLKRHRIALERLEAQFQKIPPSASVMARVKREGALLERLGAAFRV